MRQALVVAVVLLSVWLSVAHASQGGDALHPVVSLLNTKSSVLPACTKSLPRKEWRSLDAAAQQKFVNCVLKLQKSGEYDKFAALHYKQAAAIHNSPVFLPWHRWFLRQFELALLKCDATVSLPYWNVALDSQRPESSPVFGASAFGGNGDSKTECVKTGPFKAWTPATPTKHCLKRAWSKDGRAALAPFPSPEAMNAVVARAKVYDELRSGLEQNLHGLMHNNIGGDSLGMEAPNDPLYWVMHADVDRYWADWQSLKPSRLNEYGGRNLYGTAARPEDILPGYSARVQDTFDVKKLCYSYQVYTVGDPTKQPIPIPPKP